MLALIYFIILAVIAVGCSLCIFFTKHPLYASIAMVTTMLSLAGIYGLLGSPFVGAVQIMVFVLLSVVAVACLTSIVLCHSTFAFDPATVRGGVDVTAKALFNMSADGNGYYLIVLAIGLVLLSAMATAVILARKRIASDPENVLPKEVH